MPMDIRNFFAKKPSKKPPKSADSGDSKKSETSSSKKDPTAADATKDSASNPAKAPRARKAPPKKKEKPIALDDSSTDEERPAKSKTTSSSGTKKVDASTSKNEEASKDSKAAAKPRKPAAKKKERLLIIDDSSEEEESPVKSTKETTKRPVLDDSSDEEPPKRQRRAKKTEDDPASKSKRLRNQQEEDTSSPPKRVRTNKATPKKSPAKKVDPLQPSLSLPSFDTDAAAPECLAGNTFVFTGANPEWTREEAQDYVKILGGRVTGAVSSKTTYLVILGETLEDNRHYTEGSKYKKAQEIGTIVVNGPDKLYGLTKMYSDQKGGKQPETAASQDNNVEKEQEEEKPSGNPYAKKPAQNPYAKAPSKNPYAKNPYAKKPAATQPVKEGTAPQGDSTGLWVDRYAPTNTREILGNRDCVNKLTDWLKTWERRFNTPEAWSKTFSAPKGPWKAALLSGPPGIGKTTTATLVAKEAGRDVIEFNASDVRSKKAMQTGMGDVTGSYSLDFGQKKTSNNITKRCLIMDEVDGMGAGDRSGMAELIKMIKTTRVPVICICNDRQSQKMKSLLPYCMDLRFRRPVKSVLARRAVQIGAREGLSVEQNAAEAIAESCGNDVRQVLNCLQMWASDNRDKTGLTYKNLKEREGSIKKDEILRVSLFDAAKQIMEGRKGLSGADEYTQVQSLHKRNDAFFVDYSLVGLITQQNYPKVMVGQFNEVKRDGDPHKMLAFFDRLHDAAASMSDYDLAESGIHESGNQNWSLLPVAAMMTVKTGHHAGGPNGGFLPGFPEFTSWMGKNSSKGKKRRLVQELNHHMNYKVTGGTNEVRLSYLPVLRERFLSLVQSGENQAAIELMDEYGLDRDDVFEKLDEFRMDPKAATFESLDSKQKAAFTRQYNKGVHKSQALVAEQGAGKKKRAPKQKSTDATDPDIIDEDKAEEDSADEDEEAEEAAIQALFKKKGRKTAKKKAKGKK